MKKILLLTFAIGLSGSAFAQDFVQPLPRGPQTREPQTQRGRTEGGLQRAARNGNVLQAINPFAPREYGSGAAFVEYHQEDPFQRPRDPGRERPMGVRFFSFAF